MEIFRLFSLYTVIICYLFISFCCTRNNALYAKSRAAAWLSVADRKQQIVFYIDLNEGVQPTVRVLFHRYQ